MIRAVVWKDHVVATKARATAAIRDADASSSRRIVTEPTMISILETALTVGGSDAGVPTTTVANSTHPRTQATSLPCRSSVRQDDRWLAFSP
jgi:hypothetical protein